MIQPDGWLRTGDLGVMREDGCIHITGRSRDVIIRGGENIYPREVEEFLYTHPKVGEVQVVGIPNARLGEIVVAWIRLRPGVEATEEEIRELLPGTDRLLQDSRARPLRRRSFRRRCRARFRSTRCASSRLKRAACRRWRRRRRRNQARTAGTAEPHSPRAGFRLIMVQRTLQTSVVGQFNK